MSETGEIAAWLRAQAVADIEAAGKATPGPWKDDGSPARMVFQPAGTRGVAWCSNARPDEDLANSAHIARHDPLTETERAQSVLAVLDLYEQTLAIVEQLPLTVPPAGVPAVLRPGLTPGQAGISARDYLDAKRELAVLEPVVRMLAAGYRHREGYKEPWAVA